MKAALNDNTCDRAGVVVHRPAAPVRVASQRRAIGHGLAGLPQKADNMTNASGRQQAVSGAKLTFELLVRKLGHACGGSWPHAAIGRHILIAVIDRRSKGMMGVGSGGTTPSQDCADQTGQPGRPRE